MIQVKSSASALWRLCTGGIGLFGVAASLTTGLAFAQGPVQVTLLHTNDLHSHFRPDRSPLQLGGFGRIKTAVDQLKKENPHVLLVDGGDWSEGSIYYTQGIGTESIRLMDQMGYDVAVVGNHDWLNGPNILLKSLQTANSTQTSFVSANLDLSGYKKSEEFEKWVHPYVIKEVEGLKIAFIGLSTFEFIYDKFFKPIRVTEPFFYTARLASDLKRNKGVDAVVVISHNSTFANRWVLKIATDVDLVVGAHDHVKLDEPVIVKRPGAKPGWIVETGQWGRHLGRVDLTLAPHEVELNHYELMQMDFTVPEDPSVVRHIESLERLIENKYGPVFSDRIGTSELEMTQSGEENFISNLVVDSYLPVSGADLALETNTAVYGELHKGDIHTADVFNVFPAIYDPSVQKTWTLKVIPMKGSILSTFLNILYGSNLIKYGVGLSGSGIRFVYDPILPFYATNFEDSAPNLEFFTAPQEKDIQRALSFPVVNQLQIQGQDIDYKRTYWIATAGTLVEAIQTLNSIITLVPLDRMKDTGVEIWRGIGNYVRQLNHLDSKKISLGDRMIPLQADLGLYDGDVRWEPKGRLKENRIRATVHFTVKNYGASASVGDPLTLGENPKLQFTANQKSLDQSGPGHEPLHADLPIPALEPGKSADFKVDVALPILNGMIPFTVKIEDGRGNAAHANKQVTKWFNLSEAGI